MNTTLTVLAAIAVVGYVIARQLRGEALRGKRVVVLPVVLAVIGLTGLQGVQPIDLAFLIGGGVIAALIGLAQGASMRLEQREGYLWGQMPVASLWLWAGLIGSRLVLTVAAHVAGASIAGSTSSILLVLGVNRLAQAAVVVPRALTAGIPFAPEKDGSSFLASLTSAR